MNFANTSSLAVLLPACARLAAVCAAIEGREVTCPAAMRRARPTPAAVERPRRAANCGRSIETSSTAQTAGDRRAEARSGGAAPLSVGFQGIYR